MVTDIETTGFPSDWKVPPRVWHSWPRIVQIAWRVLDKDFNTVERQSFIIKPDGYDIPVESTEIHKISTERALAEGVHLGHAMSRFCKRFNENNILVAHNVRFDSNVIESSLHMLNWVFELNILADAKKICTQWTTIKYCGLKQKNSNRPKLANLGELSQKVLGSKPEGLHNAVVDTDACADCFIELVKLGVISV